MADAVTKTQTLHYCKQCGAITNSPLLNQLIEAKDQHLNELKHEVIGLTLKLKVAADMLRDVELFLGANKENLYRKEHVRKRDGSIELAEVPTMQKIVLDKVMMTIRELKK